MNIFLNRDERIAAVLDSVLPVDILSDEDMDELLDRVNTAIQRKFDSLSSAPTTETAQ